MMNSEKKNSIWWKKKKSYANSPVVTPTSAAFIWQRCRTRKTTEERREDFQREAALASSLIATKWALGFAAFEHSTCPGNCFFYCMSSATDSQGLSRSLYWHLKDFLASKFMWKSESHSYWNFCTSIIWPVICNNQEPLGLWAWRKVAQQKAQRKGQRLFKQTDGERKT